MGPGLSLAGRDWTHAMCSVYLVLGEQSCTELMQTTLFHKTKNENLASTVRISEEWGRGGRCTSPWPHSSSCLPNFHPCPQPSHLLWLAAELVRPGVQVLLGPGNSHTSPGHLEFEADLYFIHWPFWLAWSIPMAKALSFASVSSSRAGWGRGDMVVPRQLWLTPVNSALGL